MQTQEITFAELRKAYTQVREFLIADAQVDNPNFGLYSTIDEDLDLFDVPFEEDFCKKFGIQISYIQISWEERIKAIGLNLLKQFAMLPILPFVILWLLFAILWLLVLVFLNYLFPQFNFLNEKNKIISKKDWQQDKLTVADLVSTLIAKEYVRKKEVNYVLKK
jgi:hypothetical protein